MSAKSEKAKFLDKHLKQREIFQLENTEYSYFYPDRENITALLLDEKVIDKEDLESASLVDSFSESREIKSKKLRNFILGSQKFKPDYIEFITEDEDLKLRSVSVEEGFESKISFEVNPSSTINHRIDFEHIKPLKYLKKGNMVVHLSENGPIKIHFSNYDVGFLFLGS